VSNPLATATPLVNPRRKQTLLGIAPVISPGTELPAASASSPPVSPSAPPPPAATLQATSASSARANNPLKQTLLGIAPVLPNPPAVAAATPVPSADVSPAAEALEKESSLPSIAAAVAATESDAPVIRSSKRSSAPPPLPASVDRISDTDLPPLRTQRPRWVVPLVVAAVIGLGVVGLRRLDYAAVPGSLPRAAEAPNAAVPRPPQESPAPAAPATALPASEDDDTNSPAPTKTAPGPEPLATKPGAPAAATSAAATGNAAPVGDLKRIRVASDPPGARMFWRGKEVGTTPFTLELQPGEKHSYELGLPGYVTRKVVIDGSKSEVSIGMKPEVRATTGASPRK
jgi:hypothetical protein